jgi:leucine efflux protein
LKPEEEPVFGVTNLWTYAVGAALITLLPGPNSLFVLALSSRRGILDGYRGAAGILLGDTVLMILSASGAGTLLRTHQTLFGICRGIGAGYLAYVGFVMWRDAWRTWHQRRSQANNVAARTADFGPARGVDSRNPFRQALLISLLNPKMALFFLSFFVQFVDPRYRFPELSFLVLGTVIQALSTLYLTVLICVGARISRRLGQRKRLVALAGFGAGSLFIGFGGRLALASVS